MSNAIPALSFNGIPTSEYVSGRGTKYIQLPTNTVTVDGKLFHIYTSDAYEKVQLAGGRETSVKSTIIRLKEIEAKVPRSVGKPELKKVEVKTEAKAEVAKATELKTKELQKTMAPEAKAGVLAAIAKQFGMTLEMAKVAFPHLA